MTRKNVCQPLAPSTRAASSSSVPAASMTGISSRATNGNVTKSVASTMPGTAKMILHVVVEQPRPEAALAAEEQHEDQAGDHRRDGERQVDERDQQVLAAESETWRSPSRRRRRRRGWLAPRCAAASSVSRSADERVRLAISRSDRPSSPWRRLRRRPSRAAARGRAPGTPATTAMSAQRTQRGSVRCRRSGATPSAIV